MQMENSHHWLFPTQRTLVETDCPFSRGTNPTGRASRTAPPSRGYSPLGRESQTSARTAPPGGWGGTVPLQGSSPCCPKRGLLGSMNTSQHWLPVPCVSGLVTMTDPSPAHRRDTWITPLPSPSGDNPATSGAGWGAACVLLRRYNTPPPHHALGVPCLGIQNLLQGSQGQSTPHREHSAQGVSTSPLTRHSFLRSRYQPRL